MQKGVGHMRKWMCIIPVAAVVAAIVAGAGMVDAKAEKNDDTTILDRIYVGKVSVGGMTKSEAEEAVEEYVDRLGGELITLKVEDREIEVNADDLGLKWENTDVVDEAAGFGKAGNLIARYKAEKDLEHEDKVFDLNFAIDEKLTAGVLELRADDLDREPVDFGLKRENGEFQIIEGENGIAVNIEESIAAINEYFAAGWSEDASIELVADITEPKGSAEELSKVKDKLGSYSTNYASSASGRKKNLSVGSSKINGSLIYPGEVFSVHNAVAPLDASNGYELAGAYENGTTVESYGGGICQVSTTLYNAVIRAELEIVERSGHSMLVAYVDPSADAAIAGTYKDLKFKNNLDSPVYIEGYADGATIGFAIYGEETRPANREISFVSETVSTTEPTTKFVASDASIGTISQTQSSHTGKVARLWKIVTVDGVEQSREVFNNTTYSMSPTIYEVGTSSSNKEAVSAIKKAISSQDEGKIRAAAAKWNDKALKEEEKKKKQEEDKKKQEEDKKPETSEPVTPEPVEPEPEPSTEE